jgi:ABC-2 type transport system ATP-binding protein
LKETYNSARMNSTAPILEVRNLVKHYGETRAVNDVSLRIQAHQCFGLLGPNGAGKTTTIEVMEGILPPTSGQILFRGSPLDRHFRAEIGIQFQSTALQDYLTVGEALQLFHRLYGRGDRLERLIEACALGDLLDRDTSKLSGGQRQRLLLAIALVNNPAIVFLDEPTTGLDPQARRNFWRLVEHIKQEGTTIVLTTHYMEEAAILCDEIAIMDRGRLIAEGSPAQLLKNHYDDVILELPLGDFPSALEALPHRRLTTQGIVEITTRDANATILSLAAHKVPLDHLRIRPRNLEDLFLDLTGKDLRA